MCDYQKIVIIFFGCILMATIAVWLVETAIEKSKERKKAFNELVRENKQLKDKIYTLKFQEELRKLKCQ